MKALVRHPSFNWILGVVVAYCFLLLSSTAEAAAIGSVRSKPSPEGLQDSVTLHSEKGDICPEGAKRATYYVSKTKETIEGCYVIRDKVVYLGFLDGDTGNLPAEAFTWVPGQAPAVTPDSNNKPGVGPGRDTNGTKRPEKPIVAQRGGAKDTRWM